MDKLSSAVLLNALIVGGSVVFLGLQIQKASQAPHFAPTQAIAAPAKPQAPKFDPAKLRTTFDGDYVYGDRNAKTTLFVFSDFECPYCSKFYPTAKQFVDKMGPQVNMVLRLYPLDFHPHANSLALAAECIGDKKASAGFYKFADGAFAITKGGFDNFDAFVGGMTRDLGVSNADFNACMNSSKYTKKIEDDVSEGKAVGVSGTPSIVLYRADSRRAVMLSGAQSPQQLLVALQKIAN